MRCEDCPRFNADDGVCRDRKLNPKTFNAAVDVIQIFGPRSLCSLNDFREQMLDIWEGKKLPGKPPRIRTRKR